MVGGRVSGGPISFGYTKFRWNEVVIMGINWASGMLLGVIRVVRTFNRNTGRLEKYSEVG